MIKILKIINTENECIACKEAITNPICQDCLEEGILEWLDKKKPKLKNKLKEKTEEFRNMTDFSNNLLCIRCSENVNACAFCYTEFILEWLTESEPELVDEFLKYFSFRA